MRRPEPQTAEVAGKLGDASTGTTDAEIIRLSGREPERFADIFDRYYAEIYGYVERRLGPSLADDVAAETFLIAFDRRDRYDTAHSTARPWLYGIASNLISRHHRAETRHYRALTRVGPPGTVDGPADRIVGRVVAQSNRGRLATALAAIPQGGGALAWPGNSLAKPRYPSSTSAFTAGWRRNCSAMPSVRIAVWSCIRPGRSAPDRRVRPCPSLIVVILMVFCFFLPETKARRPGRPA
jgi:DNA-directed RNA polymerase specialized sigma24 family protein